MKRLGASSIARIAGNILSGFISAAGHKGIIEAHAGESVRLAIKIAELAEAYEAEGNRKEQEAKA